MKKRKKKLKRDQSIQINKKDTNGLFVNFKSQVFADKKDKLNKPKHKKDLFD